jgi:hypothetical protein
VTNVPKKVSQNKLDWRLFNPATPALCVVHACTKSPLGARQPLCAEHQTWVDKLSKKHKPTTAAYRRRVWALVTTGKEL